MLPQEATIEELAAGVEAPAAKPASDGGGGEVGFWQALRTTKTGTGDLDEYSDHPLNVTGSRPNARACRALTGLFGDGTKLAIIDLVLAGIETWWAYRRGGGTGAA